MTRQKVRKMYRNMYRNFVYYCLWIVMSPIFVPYALYLWLEDEDAKNPIAWFLDWLSPDEVKDDARESS